MLVMLAGRLLKQFSRPLWKKSKQCHPLLAFAEEHTTGSNDTEGHSRYIGGRAVCRRELGAEFAAQLHEF